MTAPIFILSAPFSGADVLTAMLGRHPQLCAVPALRLFMAERIAELLEIFRISQGPEADGVLRALAGLVLGAQDDAHIALARDWLEQGRDQSVGEILHALSEAVAPRVLVVPDSDIGLRPSELARLRAHAPQPRFLHLTRHPWSQGVVMNDRLQDRLFVPVDFKDHGYSPPILDPQIPWLRANCNLIDHAEALPQGHCLRMSWEALISDSASTLAEICRWLGIADDADALEAMQDYTRWEFWGHGPAVAPGGLDPESLEEISDDAMDEAFAAPRLDRVLTWRPEGIGFAREVIELARSFGYE